MPVPAPLAWRLVAVVVVVVVVDDVVSLPLFPQFSHASHPYCSTNCHSRVVVARARFFPDARERKADKQHIPSATTRKMHMYT
eukprot:CAMPEP_0195028748 /NCGR_PEP_ID=MMETSP0326_2-20130528/55105_1 /TAXON_ID=2866 ORGANISM="Crypthecodinium cohnii, Strain Seligo" /NCGR_SAMPLE_ID=MMETSP0326_2 /ASSEMBLY_ACC=CAM_ASM_000348 /LENGTH=82 /DNA_ID=CAMNT_0040051387 /DNA_START=27 /DNA_END=275 /DNA_ORIENTATION=-